MLAISVGREICQVFECLQYTFVAYISNYNITFD